MGLTRYVVDIIQCTEENTIDDRPTGQKLSRYLKGTSVQLIDLFSPLITPDPSSGRSTAGPTFWKRYDCVVDAREFIVGIQP